MFKIIMAMQTLASIIYIIINETRDMMEYSGRIWSIYYSSFSPIAGLVPVNMMLGIVTATQYTGAYCIRRHVEHVDGRCWALQQVFVYCAVQHHPWCFRQIYLVYVV